MKHDIMFQKELQLRIQTSRHNTMTSTSHHRKRALSYAPRVHTLPTELKYVKRRMHKHTI